MNAIVCGVFNLVAEHLDRIAVVDSDCSAAAETVNNGDIVEQIVTDLDILADALNTDWELFMIGIGLVADVDMLRMRDRDTGRGDVGYKVSVDLAVDDIIGHLDAVGTAVLDHIACEFN